MKHKVAIIGASGYTGAELIRLIETHPRMEVTALVGNTKAGLSMSDMDEPALVFPTSAVTSIFGCVSISLISSAPV